MQIWLIISSLRLPTHWIASQRSTVRVEHVNICSYREIGAFWPAGPSIDTCSRKQATPQPLSINRYLIPVHLEASLFLFLGNWTLAQLNFIIMGLTCIALIILWFQIILFLARAWISQKSVEHKCGQESVCIGRNQPEQQKQWCDLSARPVSSILTSCDAMETPLLAIKSGALWSSSTVFQDIDSTTTRKQL